MLDGKPFRFLRTLKSLVAGLILFSAFSCKTAIIVKKYPKRQPFVYETNISLTGNFSNEERTILASRLKSQLDDSMHSRAISKVFWSVMKNPPRYDSVNADKSILYMRALLKSLGYFKDTITYDTVLRIKRDDQYRTSVNFNVKPGKLTRIDTIRYNIGQQELQQIAMANMKETYLHKGEAFATASIGAELDRLVTLYRDRGFQRISRDEFLVTWDTLDASLLRPTMDPFEQFIQLQKLKERSEHPVAGLEITLRPGFDSSRLTKYYIGNIRVYPENGTDTAGIVRKEKKLKGYNESRIQLRNDSIEVVYYRKLFRPSIFPENIYLHHGEKYNQKKYFKTLNRFNSLGSWRLVSIEQLPRKNQDTIDINLRLSPAPKYSFSINLEGSRNQSAVSGNLFGLAVNTGLQDRNYAHAANQGATNLRLGIEIGDSSLLQTRQLGISQNIYFPRPIPNARWIRGGIRDNFRTVLSFNAANTERKDLYNLTTINGSWGYEFQWNRKLMTVRIPNIEYSNLTRRFKLDTLFKYNPSLKHVFTDGFISSIITGLTVTGGTPKNLNVFRANLEIPEPITTFIHNKFLDSNLYKFIKLDAEFTCKIQYGKSALAFRIFGGVGYELNSTVNPQKRNNLPFFKQYFAGGPNSMRAWGLRKLGPGSTVADFSGSTGIPERYGDVQLEGNIEWRFPITEISSAKINGALFTDLGNVWLLKKAAGTPEQVFNFSRLGKDLAIGAGAGIRIDFSFFIIRFDYSYKVKDPSPSPANAALQNKWFGYSLKEGDKFQLGIGYPFTL